MFYMLMHLYVLYHKNKNPHRSSFSCLTNLPISQGVGAPEFAIVQRCARHTPYGVKA